MAHPQPRDTVAARHQQRRPKPGVWGAGKAEKETPKGAGPLSQVVGDLVRLQHAGATAPCSENASPNRELGQDRVYSFILCLPSCPWVGHPRWCWQGFSPLTAGGAPLTIRLMSLQTSDAISSHHSGVSQEMVLHFQSIEHTTVPPPKAPNEQCPHICDHVRAFLPDFI